AARGLPGHAIDEVAATEPDLEDAIVGREREQLQRELAHRRIAPVEDARDHEPTEETRRFAELTGDERGEGHAHTPYRAPCRGRCASRNSRPSALTETKLSPP